MTDYNEILTKIKERADFFHNAGQFKEWVQSDEDYSTFKTWHENGEQGSCPIDISQYLEVQPEDKDQPVVIFEKPVEQKKDYVEIQRLISEALKSQGRGELDEALDYFNKALEIDSSNSDAIEGKKSLQKLKIEKSRNDLIYTLRHVNDPGPLQGALEDASVLLRGNPNDLEIAELLKSGKARLDEIVVQEGGKITTEFLKEYSSVFDTLNFIQEKKNKGDTTYFDPRVGKSKPIEEVLQDFTTRLVPLAIAYADKLLGHANRYLPETGRREPVLALEELQKAVGVVGLEEKKRQELEKLIKSTADEIKSWEKADREMKKAQELNVNDYERYQLLQNAKAAYPQHADVLTLEKDFTENASLYIAETLNNCISDNIRLLKVEAGAALEQRIKKQADSPLPVFENARKQIQDILLKINRIPPEWASENLGLAVEDARKFLNDLAKVENRRNEIRSAYLSISTQMKSDPKKAIKLLEGLSSDFLDDPEIKYLESNLHTYIGAEGNLQIAKKHYESRKYAACVEELEKVHDAGPLQADVDALKENGKLKLIQKDILEHWANKYFADAHEITLRLLRENYANVTLVKEIILDSKINDKEKEFFDRQAIDDQNKIAERKTDIEREWDLIKDTPLDSQNVIDWMEKTSQLLSETEVIAKLPSTEEGRLLDLAKTIKDALHEKSYSCLTTLKRDSSENLNCAYQVIQRLQQVQLIETQRDRELRKNICLEYFNSLQNALERLSRWEAIVRTWEKAVEEFSDDISVWNALKKSRLLAAVSVAREALRKFDFEKAIKIAEQSETPFAFDDQYPTIYTIEEQKDLDALAQEGTVMKNAQDLFGQKDFIAMNNTLLAIINETHSQTLQEFRKKLVGDTIGILSKEGDQVIKDNFSKGIMSFATILRLDPENIVARGKLNTYRDNVLHEIEEVKELSEEIDQSIDIDIQLEKNRKRGDTLMSLLAVIEFLGGKATQYRRPLEEANRENARIRGTLERAQKILSDLSDDNSNWKSIISRGNWDLADADINEFEEITQGHQHVLQLRMRVKNAQEQRKHRVEKLKFLQDNFMANNFDEFLTEYQTLLEELYQENPGAGVPYDKYRIFKESLVFFDPLTNSEIPFFHKEDEATCVKCLVTARRVDNQGFVKYRDMVKRECEQLTSQYEKIQPGNTSYLTLQKCRDFVFQCESKWELLKKPSEEPKSRAAETCLREALNTVSSVRRFENDIKSRIAELEAIHNGFQVDLNRAIELINAYEKRAALEKLMPARDFYIDGENEFNDFIDHAIRVCNQPAPKKKMFLEKTLQRITG